MSHACSLSVLVCVFFSSRRRHTRFDCDWSSDVCSSDLVLYPDWRSRIRWIPLVTLVGTGIALSNSRAVVEGLLFSGGNFIRTPKFDIRRPGDLQNKLRSYWLKLDLLPPLELALGVYALLALTMASTTLGIWISPFLLI